MLSFFAYLRRLVKLVNTARRVSEHYYGQLRVRSVHRVDEDMINRTCPGPRSKDRYCRAKVDQNIDFRSGSFCHLNTKRIYQHALTY